MFNCSRDIGNFLSVSDKMNDFATPMERMIECVLALHTEC